MFTGSTSHRVTPDHCGAAHVRRNGLVDAPMGTLAGWPPGGSRSSPVKWNRGGGAGDTGGEDARAQGERGMARDVAGELPRQDRVVERGEVFPHVELQPDVRNTT